MPGRSRSLRLIGAILVATALAGPAVGAPECSGDVRVVAEDPGLAPMICEAVDVAREAAAACGFGQSRAVTIEIVAAMDAAHDTCAAYYDCETDRLTVLSPEALAASGEVLDVFRGLEAEAYFRSVIVHEMIHAFLDQTVEGGLPRLAHEYLAYAIQIAALPEAAQVAALSSTGIDGDVADARLSPALFAFDPSLFAARAYTHFTQPGNGCAFAGRILARDPSLPEAFRARGMTLMP